VLVVVLFHVGYLPGGFIGVDVFFVISGFVVSRSLMRSLAAPGGRASHKLGRFYRRRVARLLPAFAVVAGPVALLAVVFAPIRSVDDSLGTAITGLLLVSNGFLYRIDSDYFGVGTDDNAFLHLWSLSVEEQFYLVFPTLLVALLIVGKGGHFRRRSLVAISVLTGLSFLASLDLSFRSGPLSPFLTAPEVFAFFSPVTRAWEFGLGVLLALSEPRWNARRGPAPIALSGAGLLAVGLVATDGASPFPGWIAALSVLGTAFLIVGGGSDETDDPGRTRPLEAPWLVWMGDVSYSWYLWHWPFVVFARASLPQSPWAIPLAGAASLLPAWLSYRYVEERLRVHRGNPSALQSRKLRGSLAIGVGALVLAGAGLVWARSPGHPATAHREQVVRHLDVLSGCDFSVSGSPEPDDCRWGASEGATPVYLVGDSNAGQFTEAVIAAGEAVGRAVVVRTASGCQLSLAPAAGSADGCERFTAEIVGMLESEAPSTVLVAVSFQSLRPSEADQPAGGVAGAAPRPALEEVLRPLVAVGHRVVLLAEIPKFESWPVGACSVVGLWVGGDASCVATRDLTDADPVQTANRRLVTALQERLGGLEAVDFSEELCPDGNCRSHREGVLIWRDAGHLSVAGARLLTDDFVAVLNSAPNQEP